MFCACLLSLSVEACLHMPHMQSVNAGSNVLQWAFATSQGCDAVICCTSLANLNSATNTPPYNMNLKYSSCGNATAFFSSSAQNEAELCSLAERAYQAMQVENAENIRLSRRNLCNKATFVAKEKAISNLELFTNYVLNNTTRANRRERIFFPICRLFLTLDRN